MRLPPTLAAVVALPLIAWAEDPAPPALTEERYEELRGLIAPSPEECEFLSVGWRPSFGEAVKEARETGRPVFLWAMNGHPLACT